MLEQVNELQTGLYVVMKELMSLKDEGTPSPETIYLEKILRKLKLHIKFLVSEHTKLIDLITTIKDYTKSDHSSPAI